jgi:CheY-like chemotaxis protein
MPGLKTVVLVVDDQKGNRNIIRRMIEDLAPDISVEEACNGLEAVTYVDESKKAESKAENKARLALIVMDHTMPKMDGPTAAKTIHAKHPEIPIASWTTNPVTTLDEAFSDTLPKTPLDREALSRLLKKYAPALVKPSAADSKVALTNSKSSPLTSPASSAAPNTTPPAPTREIPPAAPIISQTQFFTFITNSKSTPMPPRSLPPIHRPNTSPLHGGTLPSELPRLVCARG